MNVCTIVGNLTRDPETKSTQDGKTVCNFTVAVNRKTRDRNGDNIADFFRVSAWGQMGENCQKYLGKGKKVSVTGSVSVHPYTGSDGTPKANIELFAKEVEFLTPVGNGNGSSGDSVSPNMTPVNTGDELPF